MVSLDSSRRYFLYHPFTDMRKGFDGLSGIVRNQLNQDPLLGDIFIFLNRRRNQIKLLLWEGDGFSIYFKRLEMGTYELPAFGKESLSMGIRYDELMLILQGIQLQSVRRRRRYKKSKKNTIHNTSFLYV
ncbi:MAG: IS66 family insertion sequence element accessory protein TnpB [Candidatus Heimdallarchaeota archaeon]|nr:IS66 family insertion sequence element accessory protein TnpB [Candidatus Heimdallarchaeota archaeon]